MKVNLQKSKLILAGIGILFAPFCLSEPIANNFKNSSFPTHNEVPNPPSVFPNKELLVGLEPFLGKQVSKNLLPSELLLQANGKPLILKDSNGVMHKATEIKITWQKVSLKKPKQFTRQVLGPFASFESAKRFSSLLAERDIHNEIAHPWDWEVWISEEVQLPKDMKSQGFHQIIFEEIKPFVKLGKEDYLLSGPILINAPDGMFWKGGLYLGPFLLKKDAYGTWTLIEKVPLERYLLGVVPHEIGHKSPFSALAAQAVLARTWALANTDRFEIDGYHLCNSTQCQVYKDPDKANLEVLNAIKKTSGKVLTWEGNPINAVYHATNGGITASAEEAWQMKPLSYLKTSFDGSSLWKRQFSIPLDNKELIRSFLDKKDGAYGNNHSLFRWTRKLNESEIRKILKVKNERELEHPLKIRVVERGPSGRVLALEILGRSKSSSVILRKDAIRRTFRKLPSTLFVLNEVDKGVWQFSGGGFGHGAGLSQAGAIDMALRGWSTRKILNHYYPGTRYEALQ